jgi:uncharacterized protein YbjT (DUF2867 family)
MSNVLILGATGSLARVATDLFLRTTDVHLTLYARSAQRLRYQSDRVRLIAADVLDEHALQAAMAGQDVVYANLAGDLERMAKAIVNAMTDVGVRRLIFISSMGIYDEVPGQKYSSVLDPYRKAADVIEGSSLDYTILRPAWFTHGEEVDYHTTQKGEPFQGSVVSRMSVASLVVDLAMSPGMEVRHSLGVSKP